MKVGPATTLEGLYREQGGRMWRSLLAYAGDREIASDAVAEAFAQALRRGDAIRDPAAWVWRAAFRIAAGELKGRSERGRGSVRVERSPGDPADESFGSASALMAALSALSPRQRAAVVLHHYAGYPVREVAVMLGSTGPAVRVHLSRGRKRLRALLERDDD